MSPGLMKLLRQTKFSSTTIPFLPRKEKGKKKDLYKVSVNYINHKLLKYIKRRSKLSANLRYIMIPVFSIISIF